MKKIIGALFLIALTWGFVFASRAMMRTGYVQAASVQSATQYVLPSMTATITPIPTPTVGYEATLAVAQSTADEARRVNAEVTAEHESFLLSQMQLTAAAEVRAHEVMQMTAQAAPTALPLTATMQVVINTQIAQGQALQASALTATKYAPTQISAMAQAQASVRYASVARAADIFGKVAMVVFLLALIAFITRLPIQIHASDAPAQSETVVHMRHDLGQGDFSQVRLVVPCAPEQLTELAELAANGEKKFGINRLESTSRTFKSQRETLLAVRQFLLDNNFVIVDANGSITLNDAGETFLAGWFDEHKLPIDFEFAPEKEPEPENQVAGTDYELV